MELKHYIGVGFFFAMALFFIGYNGCSNAANKEQTYTYSLQRVAKNWVRGNPQLSLNEDTVVCTPRSFGNRWPTDFHRCHALSKVINPMIGAQTITFACNQQGCVSITQPQLTIR